MDLFLSRYSNSIDKKGRVSVPSLYRNILEKEGGKLVLYPSLQNQCVQACCISTLDKLVNIIDNLDPFSKERDAFQTTVMSESHILTVDPEGRIMIPKLIADTTQISKKVVFVGKGRVFEIWQPELFQQYLAKCQLLARKNLQLLKW